MAKPNPKKLLPEARKALSAGDPDYALVLLRDAHTAAPRDPAIAKLLAEVFLAVDAPMDAIETLADHLAANGKSVEAAQMLSALLAEFTPVAFGTVSSTGIAAALSLPQVTPEPLATAAGLMLTERLDLEAAEAAGLDAMTAILDPELDLLLALLRAAPVTQPSLERTLIALRRAALLQTIEADGPVMRQLLGALVAQLWQNEFVWPVSPEEGQAVQALSATEPADMLRCALYLPPEHWPAGMAAENGGRPAELDGLIAGKQKEDREMARADDTLGTPVDVRDETGAGVAAQYEDNPYPRWHWVQPPKPGAARGRLTALTRHAPDDLSDGWQKDALRILLAGCGTGEQAIYAAQAYAPKANVLAIDFSRTSLRYAAMKARQHRTGNIRFRQADIMDLPAFDAPFDEPADLIECVGVLHHLADPFAGWRRLLDRLKPGGIMYVGLYSATARRDLTALRQQLNDDGVSGSDPDAVRTARARILSAPVNDFERGLADSADFYTLSNVRDLLFHAHEIPLTLQQIGGFVEETGLNFLAMDVRPHVAEKFAAAQGEAENDLAAWAAFEDEHPDTFDGMYLFWVQRPV